MALSQDEARRIARECGWSVAAGAPVTDYCPVHARLGEDVTR
jgi:hypothetical protein